MKREIEREMGKVEGMMQQCRREEKKKGNWTLDSRGRKSFLAPRELRKDEEEGGERAREEHR